MSKRLSHSGRIAPRRPRRTALLVAGCLPFISACGLLSGSEEYLAQVDSVAVTPPAMQGGAVGLTYHGYVGSSGCASLVRVERRTLPADTLQVRFIARFENGNCTQAPIELRYMDSLPSTPARTVHLLVPQRTGAPFRRTLVLPLVVVP